jgi:hypothetical protein
MAKEVKVTSSVASMQDLPGTPLVFEMTFEKHINEITYK